MASVDTAIKDLFKEQLGAVQERQDKQDERCNNLESQLKAVEEQLQAKTAEAQQLREDLEKQKQDLQTLEGRTKVLEDHDVETLKARMERLHNDPEGSGGLLQVVQKTEEMLKELQAMMPRVEESTRLSHASKTRTDEFAETLRGFDRRREDLDKFAKETQERLEAVEGQSRDVKDKQEAVEASVALKYERLWQEVLQHIEKIESSRAESEAAGASKKGELATKDTKSLVNYALHFVATGHEQRKSQEWTKMMVTAWREQTWSAARRHMGIRQLHNLLRKQQRKAVQRWQQQTAVSHMREDIVAEYSRKLEPVQTQAQELAQKVEAHASTWQQRFEEKENSSKVDEKLASHVGKIDEKMKALHTVQEQITSHSKRLEDLDTHLQSQTNLHDNHKQRIGELKAHSEAIREELPEYARATEVQGMLRDLMLIWNLVKQLDAAKGDKKEVDALAVESANSLSKFERRVEGIKEDFAVKVREEASRTEEKWSALDRKIDDSTQQMRQWEKMWEKMDSVMEDVMKKMTTLQQQGADLGRMPSATLRKALSREPSRSKKERDTPPMPMHSKSMDISDARDPGLMKGFQSQANSPEILRTGKMDQGPLSDGMFDQDAAATQRPRAQLVPGRPRSAFSARR
mmetsp:Transcript_63303/g.150994  ORF Transcript_63303/g.150994 Transcript_63303/m.150994 type:complete len:633 (-) Transcript_63303:107-2005(-)